MLCQVPKHLRRYIRDGCEYLCEQQHAVPEIQGSCSSRQLASDQGLDGSACGLYIRVRCGSRVQFMKLVENDALQA
ncbi:hypothetical protein ASC76_13910 [Rhizobacter sp. Root404]|nr:hypothetical protein ASC76_13910 [Rhizobacter sp. Root404]